MLRFDSLAWDSEFFGFKVGRINGPFTPAGALAQLLASARSQSQVQLVYGQCESADAASSAEAVSCKGFLADAKRTYFLALNRELDTPLPPQVSAATNGTISLRQLRWLAWQSAEFSRFRIDPAMPTGAWRRMYSTWMYKSLTRELADQVLVERVDGAIVGMLTIKYLQRQAEIGLFAVAPDLRGRGIGRRLLAAARHHGLANDCDGLQVVTQGTNLPACRIYESAGYELRTAYNIFHFWS